MEKRKPVVVRLSGNMSLEEIDKEIDKFRKDHINFEIILIEKKWYDVKKKLEHKLNESK